MKTALLISGQPRSVQETYNYIYTNVIEPNDPDVFVHMWDDESLYGNQPISAGGVVASNPIPHDIFQIIQDLYHPVSCITEKPIQFKTDQYTNIYPQIKPQSSLSQRYSVLRAFQLMETRAHVVEEYDMVIRMRFDWAIKTPIIVSDLPKDAITMPNDCPHKGGINDQFAVGNMYNMRKYANLFNHIPLMYGLNIPLCDEIYLGQLVAHDNIPVNLINIPYHLQRATT